METNRIEFAPHTKDIIFPGQPTLEHLGGWIERINEYYDIEIQKYFNMEAYEMQAEIKLIYVPTDLVRLDTWIEIGDIGKKVSEYAIAAEEMVLGRWF